MKYYYKIYEIVIGREIQENMTQENVNAQTGQSGLTV
jgi:hypothetical protein